jgi:hypothetical protein
MMGYSSKIPQNCFWAITRQDVTPSLYLQSILLRLLLGCYYFSAPGLELPCS